MSVPVWVVFKEGPNAFAVRCWRLEDGALFAGDTPPAGAVATLEDARALIPEGLRRVERGPIEDPSIVETWL